MTSISLKGENPINSDYSISSNKSQVRLFIFRFKLSSILKKQSILIRFVVGSTFLLNQVNPTNSKNRVTAKKIL